MTKKNIRNLSKEKINQERKNNIEFIENNKKLFYKVNELKEGLEFIRYHTFGIEGFVLPDDVLCKIISIKTIRIKEGYSVLSIEYENKSKNNGIIRQANVTINSTIKNRSNIATAAYGPNYSMQYFVFKKCDNNINNNFNNNSNNKKPSLNNFKKNDFAIISNNNSTFTLVKIIDINENGTKNIVPIFENLKILI
jgi:hypothetical protein